MPFIRISFKAFISKERRGGIEKLVHRENLKWLVTAGLVVLIGVGMIFKAAPPPAPRRPFPQHTLYTVGSIRPDIRTQKELDAEVADYFTRWKAHYLWTVPNADPLQKIVLFGIGKEWASPQVATVSEAHGYGMIILATMAGYDPYAQRDFDALFHLYEAHPSRGNAHFMCWHLWFIKEEDEIVGVRNTPGGPFSATDGDMDIAYALLMAHQQWGSQGKINYKEEALQIIQALMASVVCQEEWVLQLGDWVAASPYYHQATRSSDFMLHHLYVFAQVDEENREKWRKVYNKKLEIINQTHERLTPRTALLPDFFRLRDGEFLPAKGTFLETKHDGDFSFNACRVPWRLGVAYLLLGEEGIRDELETLNTWIREITAGEPLNINPGYYVWNAEEGTPIVREWEGTCMSFIAPFAVSASIDAEYQAWLNRLWLSITADCSVKGIPFEVTTYYPNTIRMLTMLIVSGNAWLPLP